MAFTFPFQKVLDYKEKEKEFAQTEYGTSKLKQVEIDEQMQDLAIEKEQVFMQYNHADRKTVSELQEVQQELEHLNLKMQKLQVKSNEIHLEVERNQQVLIERLQETKMWNQWKTKSMAAFQKQAEKKEQALLDEMAVLRYSRKA
ncbi:flagellar export protein FliJ [Neobacillus mesonae]|uniref:flagellar export protein FliJ n=1 Tax=Neobacillus mesonae TaxID=1193713 RepID=UPI00203C2F84|nr:flagellar export protein FliJ [Neobacillus mesonae]MCM3569588.1 flagellar export protein FliJ [Neobacillus mesonae]